MAVTILCAGGLGNQLFQYAAARSLCDAQGQSDLIIDTRFYFPPSDDPNKAFCLDRFPVRGRIQHYPRAGYLSAYSIMRRIQRLIQEKPFLARYDESRPGYNEHFSRCSGASILTGYFQSHLYFWHNIARIRDDLNVSPDFNRDYAEAAATAGDFVSVHVRRGDYVGDANFEMSDLSGYYARAMQVVRARLPAARFRIFSDDIGWCRRSSLFADTCEYFEPNSPMGPVEDLMVMSRCAHHIVANSSYSWWGAVLRGDERKTVVAPRQWIYGFSSDDMQIIPPGWIQV